jgi:secreted Zn-dependent insulinase-like peptidase
LQGESDSIEDQARMMLLEQTMNSGFYNRLRTEQQLGYIVSVTSINIKETPSVGFVVQSPNTSISNIRKAMFDYFESFDPSKDLEQNKQALIAKLLEAPKNLFERSNSYWNNIGHDDSEFDRQEELAKIVDGFNAEEFSEFAHNILKNGKWLWYAAAEESEMPEGIKPIDNIQQFKFQSDVYTYP